MDETKKEQTMKNGVKTAPLYIKHLALEDWELLAEIRRDNPEAKTVADAVRFAIKRATNRI